VAWWLVGGAVGGVLDAGMAIYTGEADLSTVDGWATAGLRFGRGFIGGALVTSGAGLLLRGAAPVLAELGIAAGSPLGAFVTAHPGWSALATLGVGGWLLSPSAQGLQRAVHPRPDAHDTPRPPDLPVKPVGGDVFARVTPAMPTTPRGEDGIWMPDQTLPAGDGDGRYPPRYRYSPTLQGHYEYDIPSYLAECWQSFGDPGRVTALPHTMVVPTGWAEPPGRSGALARYTAMAQKLQAAYANFERIHQEVAGLTRTAAAISAEGQAAMRRAIVKINERAPRVPDPKSEDQHITDYLAEAVDGARQALQATLNRQRGTARDLDARTRELDRDRWDRDRVDDTDAEVDRRLSSAQERQRRLESERSLADMMRQFDMQQRLAAAQQARQPMQAPFDPRLITPQPQAPAPPTPELRDPRGLGGIDPSMLLMMSGLLRGGGLFGADRNDRPRDDRRREDREEVRRMREELAREREQLREERARAQLEARQGFGAPLPMVAAAANPPAPPPPPKPDEAQPNSQPAKDNASAQAGATQRTPGEDGKVLYTFADGRQQRVLPVVAQALDVACTDNAGTNAQAAYAGTPAKWTDDKTIGARVDPNQLMTGDVCAFEQTTAIAVVWGTADSGTLELVVDGKPVPFNPESSEMKAFGPFVGFFHPNIGQAAPDGDARSSLVASPAPAVPALAAPA
jgi:hypothetical protein